MFSSDEQLKVRASQVYQDFMHGVRQSFFQPVRSWEYDIVPALQYIHFLGPNEVMALDKLTIKTAWLLAVVGFLRPSDLARIDLDQTQVLTGNILRILVLAPKEKRKGCRITKPITIHPHEDPLLCPVQVFEAYCARVASSPCLIEHPVFPHIRINAMFRSLQDSTASISVERIFKHIQSLMMYVGRIEGAPLPKARALGSTLAAQAGVAMDDIVVHGNNWSSKELFERFYRILSVSTSNNFTTATLNSQQRS